MKNKILSLLALSVLLFSCNKSEEASLRIRMTDAPGDYQEVNVEIEQVSAQIDADDPNQSGWYDLPTNQGIYDLLEYQDTNSFEVAYDASLPVGVITELRFLLGDANTVLVDSVYYDLKTPSGQQSGLKIKNVNIPDDGVELLIDFDAEASVHQTGNGKYILKPVLKVVDTL
ncbi:protein of unknown function [Lishizhenia tianjinensis]|uniref:DUF4382 domain-containing protein n=1 Tax=Lishizhenia tianjinensis TaxID=477690 RepID=A0A1I7BQW7_9FLAO|nr:DUF4382 domain-containing protein [Lishizhenia tianjinensis]SFT89513.1 protein of unknown function [Lishizhenia tianjinensis]